MGFLRQRKDGTTSITVLTPCQGIVPGSKIRDQPVLLGSLSGRLTQGSTHIMGLKDEKKNLQRPSK
jgi:bromodomain-containing protein 7